MLEALQNLFTSDIAYVMLSIIIAIFLLFFLLRIFRFIYNLIRYFFLSYKYRVRYSQKSKKVKKKKPNFFSDEFKEKNKEKEEKKIAEIGQEQNKSLFTQESRIVSITEPIGKWTQFVTNQKMSWLMAMVGTKTESDKFWQNMIIAQDKAKGKRKSRQR